MFGLSSDLDLIRGQIIAALLTIAFVNNRKEEQVGIDNVWNIYEKFLNKQEQHLVSKEDYKKIIEILKEQGVWK